MLNPTTRRQWLFSSLAASTLSAAAGCGSILFPERSGQPRGGPLDWKVVALDGIGLFFFFVPGVIAFAVDFYNGTIFLPAHGVSAHRPASPTVASQSSLPPLASPHDATASDTSPAAGKAPAASPAAGFSGAPSRDSTSPTDFPLAAENGFYGADQRLEQVPLPAGPDRLQHVEQIVTARAGQPVRLEPGSYQMAPLERIEHFWDTLRETAGLPGQPS